MSEKAKKPYFPLFVDLSNRQVYVVGAGTIALRRIQALTNFADHLTVIAPEIAPELERLEREGRIFILRKIYETGDLQAADLVIAATSDHRVNEEIYDFCRKRGILVNICSDRSKCDFYFPGLALGEDVVVGVTANGRDHRKARSVTEQIREILK